jgi:hypothetical protein
VAGNVAAVLAVYLFAGWTAFVWTTRVRNIVGDGGSGLDLALAGSMAVLGVAVGAVAWRARPRLAPVLAVAVVATVVTWALRTPLILLDPEHPLAFKAVHSALAAVSVALALVAWRAAGARRPAPSRSLG